MKNQELSKFKKVIRKAIANYMYSEGCSCCQNVEAHEKHKQILAKLLNVKPYPDNSMFDFYKYRDGADNQGEGDGS